MIKKGVVLFLTVLVSTLSLASSYQYRGDALNTSFYGEYGINEITASSKYVLDGYKISAQPVMDDDGNIYLTASKNDLKSGLILCLDSELKLKWKNEFKSAIYSSPILDTEKGIVYIGLPSETNGDDGQLKGYDITNGKEKMSVKKGFINGAPALDFDGNIIVAEGKNLSKIDSIGKVLWSYKLRDSSASKPALYEGNIYLPSHDGYIYCISLDGKLVWEKNFNMDFSASPAIDGTGNIYIGGLAKNGQSKFMKLDNNGKEIWKIETGVNTMPGSAALDETNERVVFLASSQTPNNADGSFIWSADLKGNVMWKYKTMNNYLPGSPCIDRTGNVYIGYDKTTVKDTDGIFAGFDIDGKQMFEFKTQGDVVGSPIMAGSSLIFGDMTGTLYIVK